MRDAVAAPLGARSGGAIMWVSAVHAPFCASARVPIMWVTSRPPPPQRAGVAVVAWGRHANTLARAGRHDGGSTGSLAKQGLSTFSGKEIA